MKLFGFLLTILCTGGIGFTLVRTMQKRVEELEWFLRLLTAVREELNYSRAEVEELLAAVSHRQELERVPFLLRFQEIPREEAPFPVRWKEAVAAFAWSIDCEEQEMIASLSAVLGAYDWQNQCNALTLLEHRTTEKIQEAKAFREKHSRLYPTLGLLSGAAICIFLA